jgi:hypothetical protein
MIKLTTYDDLKNQINKKINKYKKTNKINTEQEFDVLISSPDVNSRQLLMLKDLVKAGQAIDKIKAFNRQTANSHFYSDIANKSISSNLETILRNGKTKFAKRDKDLDVPQFTSNSPFSHTLHKDMTKLKSLQARNRKNYVNNILKPREGQTIEFERIENINIKIDNDSGLTPVIKDLISADLTNEIVISQLKRTKELITWTTFESALKSVSNDSDHGENTNYKLPQLHMYQVFIATLIQVFVPPEGKYASICAYPPMQEALIKMITHLTSDGSTSVSKLPYGISKLIIEFRDIMRQKAKDLEYGDDLLYVDYPHDFFAPFLERWTNVLNECPPTLMIIIAKIYSLWTSLEFNFLCYAYLSVDNVAAATENPLTLYQKVREEAGYNQGSVFSIVDMYMEKTTDDNSPCLTGFPMLIGASSFLGLAKKNDLSAKFDHSSYSYMYDWLSHSNDDVFSPLLPDIYWVQLYIDLVDGISSQSSALITEVPERHLVSHSDLSTIAVSKATTYAPTDLDLVSHVNNGFQVNFGDVNLFTSTLSNELTLDATTDNIIYPENTPSTVKDFVETNMGIDESVEGAPIEDFKQINSIGDLQLLIKQWYRQLEDRTILDVDSLIDYIKQSQNVNVFTIFGMGFSKFKVFLQEVFSHITSSDPELVNNLVSIDVEEVLPEPEPTSLASRYGYVPTLPLAQFAIDEAISWSYKDSLSDVSKKYPCFCLTTIHEIATYHEDHSVTSRVLLPVKRLHSFDSADKDSNAWFVNRFFSYTDSVDNNEHTEDKRYTLASATFALNNIKVESPVFVQNVTYSNLLHLDMGSSQFSKDLASFIKELFASENSGATSQDLLDQFLTSANGAITANISSLISYLSQLWDRVTEDINSRYEGDLRRYLVQAAEFVKSRYSDTSLDFISHVFTQFYDNFDSPSSILAEFKSDLLSLFEAHKTELYLPDPLILESLISIIYEQLFSDFSVIISQIKSIALNPIAKATKTVSTILTQGADGIVKLMEQVSNITSQIQQNISSFDFWSLDQFDKLNNFDLMDMINVFNKLYRVLAQRAVDEFKQFVNVISSLPIPEQIERFNLIFKGYISSLFAGIAAGLDSKAAAMSQYLNDLLPNLLSQIPQILSNLATFATDMAASLVSHALGMIQGIFNLADELKINTSATLTIDNLTGAPLWSYNFADKPVLAKTIRDLNQGTDYSVVLQDTSNSVLYLLDTGLSSLELYADCVDGQLKHCLSFTNASKYKGYESIARTMPQINTAELRAKLKALSTAEEVVRTLSVLDQGPSFIKCLSPIHWALKAAQAVVDTIGEDLIDEISNNIPAHLATSYNASGLDEAIVKIATLAVSGLSGVPASRNEGSSSSSMGMTIQLKPVAYYPDFRVHKKGAIQHLVDTVLLIGMAALLAVCVATGGAAISLAINGVTKGLASVTRIAYKKHKQDKFISAIDKELGSRKHVADSVQETIQNADSQSQFYLNSLPVIED